MTDTSLTDPPAAWRSLFVDLTHIVAMGRLPEPRHLLAVSRTDHLARLELFSIADATTWVNRLDPHHAWLGLAATYDDGRPFIVEHVAYRGWTVIVAGSNPAPAGPLPKLGEHVQASGWAGAGAAGVACACGVAYSGFDTLAEALQLLDEHIAASTGAQPVGVTGFLRTLDEVRADVPVPSSTYRPDYWPSLSLGACDFDEGLCACDHRPSCIPNREATR